MTKTEQKEFLEGYQEASDKDLEVDTGFFQSRADDFSKKAREHFEMFESFIELRDGYQAKADAIKKLRKKRGKKSWLKKVLSKSNVQ